MMTEHSSEPLLRAVERQHLLRPGAGAFRPLDRRAARPDRLPARRQRQRQVDDHEDDPRPGEAALGRRDLRRRLDHRPDRRRRSSGAASARCRRRGGCSRDMTVRENMLMGAFMRNDSGASRAAISNAMLTLFPQARRAAVTARRHALGRRAADGRDGARADEPAARDRAWTSRPWACRRSSSIACWS